MPIAIRRPLLPLVLIAAGASPCRAQLERGPSSTFSPPFWGFGRPPVAGMTSFPQPTNPDLPPAHGIGLGIVGVAPGPIGVGAVGWGYSFSGKPAPFVPPATPLTPEQAGPGGLWLTQPTGPTRAASPAARPRANPARAAELLLLGDRAFRGGNTRKAEERYQLAARADGSAPTPHVRLAQVALIRQDYAKAAEQFRASVEDADGRGWLLDAPDIQSLYGEPREFARRIAQLESHLQARPEDADAWFVLGAERYLSGHPREAVDALARLAARPDDPALTSFLDAATVSMRSLARGEVADRDAP